MEKRNYNPKKFKVKYEKHKPNSRAFAPRMVKAWPKEETEVADFDDAPKIPQILNVGDGSFCSTKYIDPNSTSNITAKNIESSTVNEVCYSESKNEDAPVKVSAKSQLHEVCAADNWKPPLFPVKVSAKSQLHEVCAADNWKPPLFPVKVSAKSQLHEVCAVNNWKPPLFECCKEEGPDHLKLFTYKVTFVIESSKTFLESFGAPQPKKKIAAEHAAEGALWYLNHLGYFPIEKRNSTNKFQAHT
ncbi:endoribonuclease Dicer homolog 4-like isoform X2 [Pistacia vera]|uniref:endoribonuclease Dicer homolog 4-like isoform X2 n=1 Tax=Pistacia vera TaxID=55513 RepID=UPI001262CFC6|nr:endoribonuclease Dicer homolog 4-like isoform X2 [Pistacia vera]